MNVSLPPSPESVCSAESYLDGQGSLPNRRQSCAALPSKVAKARIPKRTQQIVLACLNCRQKKVKVSVYCVKFPEWLCLLTSVSVR